MMFLAFLLFVWLLLVGIVYAAWMLRDAWKKGQSMPESACGPWFRRLCPTKEIASQVLVALGVSAVVGYASLSVLRDESFQGAREATGSWVTSWKSNERSSEQSLERIPEGWLFHNHSQPGQPVWAANVGGHPITDDDLRRMTQEYPEMAIIVLSGTKVTDQGLACLSRWKNLQTVVLDNTRVTSAGLPHLAALPDLRVLGLAGCPICDVGIARLTPLGKLRALNLERTQVTDVGLASLAGMTELGELDLSGTAITEAGLRQLETLPMLRNVLLNDTSIPPEAKARFCNR